MGANDDVVITHIADEGISLETTPTGTTAGTIIHFKNKRTTIADGEMIARLLFQTPSESDGSDAIVSTAEIGVKAIEAFAADANRSAVTFGFADGGTTITEALRIVPEGIKFPASVNLSTDANTLDDYEEGTWTPNFANLDVTPTEKTGRYVKIGRMVWATVSWDPPAAGASSNHDYSGFLCDNLPFTAINDNGCGTVTYAPYERVNRSNMPNGSTDQYYYHPIWWFINKNSTSFEGTSVAGNQVEYTGRQTQVSEGDGVRFGLCYETAS